MDYFRIVLVWVVFASKQISLHCDRQFYIARKVRVWMVAGMSMCLIDI
jgi:hypothetical protein